jgi:RNA polymerase sigma-70 factor (ECF subfamily)
MTPEPLQKVSSTCWDWAELRGFCFSQALRVVGTRDAADDAAQEAILRAWRHRDSCRQPDHPLGWLRRIAHNEAVRVAVNQPNEVPQTYQLSGLAEAGSVAEDLENRLFLQEILKTLSESDQELVRLRYYEDLTCAKLADHFGLSEATVKVRLHRMRRRLIERLEGQT